MRIGFHMPFSGSLGKLSERIHVSRGNTFQIFARSLRGLDREGNPHSLSKLTDKKIESFHSFLSEKNIEPIIVHAPYFYNLSQEKNYKKNGEEINHRELLMEDLEWSNKLGASYYILQPGYFKKLNKYFGIENIKENLISVLEQVDFKGKILIKNTAGAGTEIASTYEEWNELISFHHKIKGALDFARVYASGYDFTNKKLTESFFDELNENVGWDKIEVCYINDTNRGCGSNKQPSSPPPLGEGVIGFYGYEEILRKEEVKSKIWLIENQPKPSYYDQSLMYLSEFFK